MKTNRMKSSAARLAAPALIGLLLTDISTAATSIGVNYSISYAPASQLAASDSAGAPGFKQTNYNNVNLSNGNNSTVTSLRNNLGVSTLAGASLSSPSGLSAGYAAAGLPISGADESLFAGYAFDAGFGSPAALTLSLSDIPFLNYSLVLYGFASYKGDRAYTATVGTTSFYGNSPQYLTTSGYVDGNSNTPFSYQQSSGTTPATATANGTHFVFTNLSGLTQTVTLSSSNGNSGPGLSGFQIIDTTVVPEPSAALLGGIGCLLLFRRRRA